MTYSRSGRRLREGLLSLAVLSTAAFFAVPVSAQRVREGDPIDRFQEECHGDPAHANEEQSRLSDECFPLADVPGRPRPILELGPDLLGTGTLAKGIKLPGGAVWQPSFVAFGTIRTALQGSSAPALTEGGDRVQRAEAVARFDLFGNLYLTQTERVLVGFRPLDQQGSFTGFTILNPDSTLEGEFNDELNAELSTLFFEGDLSELFPNLDKDDNSGLLDVYFSVGRQPLSFGDGLIVNEDQLDMVGLTKANMKWGSLVNTRVTGVFAWGELNRFSAFGNRPDPDGMLVGLFSEVDLRASTIQLDVAAVLGSDTTEACMSDFTTSCGNGIFASLGDIRRIGHYNNTFRVLASFPMGAETPFNRQGVLVHNQFGWTPAHSYNYWYIGLFAGIGEFRSAVRGPPTGGPVGPTGILFAAPGIGSLGAVLPNNSDNAYGGSIGHQMFFGPAKRTPLILEVGGRTNQEYDSEGVTIPTRTFAGAGARFQSAMGRRFVLVIDGLGNYDIDASDTILVGRLELQLQL